MKASASPRFPEVVAWVERYFTADRFFWIADERTLGSEEHVWTLQREGERWNIHIQVSAGAVRSDRLTDLLVEAEHWVPRLRRGEINGITIRSTGVDLWAGPERW